MIHRKRSRSETAHRKGKIHRLPGMTFQPFGLRRGAFVESPDLPSQQAIRPPVVGVPIPCIQDAFPLLFLSRVTILSSPSSPVWEVSCIAFRITAVSGVA